MLFRTRCMTCVQASIESGGTVQPPTILGELLEDTVVRAECPNGHVHTTVLQAPAFEILFEYACLALLDGITARP